MFDYRIDKAGTVLRIVSRDEMEKDCQDISYYSYLAHSLKSVRYSKAEIYRDTVIGTVCVPSKNLSTIPFMSFGFYINDEMIMIIEDSGDIRAWIEKKKDVLMNISGSYGIFEKIAEEMIDDDVLYLGHLEKVFEKLEDDILNNTVNDFYSQIKGYRKKLFELHAYYNQLLEMMDIFYAHSNEYIWQIVSHRIERLANHVAILKEELNQLRELHESRENYKGNRIMGILTVVTTFFLPLTLISGWYGMNFENMPELKWTYGYPMVIAVSLMIAVIEYVYFKRKKFF